MNTDSAPLTPLTLFKEELSSEELSVRVNTIHRLPLVINLIANSPPYKDQLFTILDALIDTSDDDEVLFGFAQVLTCLSRFYPPQKLLALYEKLLASEETIVRDKTIESFLSLSHKMDRNEMAIVIVPFVLKLASTQTFAAKMSVLSIMTDLFPVLSAEEKSLILEKIGLLFAEESLILRRNLASKIGKICKYLSKEALTVEIFNHFKNLTNDDSDSVRIITIESLIELASVFNVEENKAFVIPLIIQMTGDKSWRVKLHLAKNFAKLAHAVGKDISDNSLISIFSTLLRDPENEVRVASVRSLKQFVDCLNPDKIPQIFAYLQSMAKDSVPLVRTGACEVLQTILRMDVNLLGKEVAKTRVQPILIDLCQDKDTEVRIETLKILPLWARFVGMHLLDLINNGTLVISQESPNWRIRLAVVECFGNIANEFKNTKAFDKNIRKIIATAMGDKAFQVRKHVIKSIREWSLFLDDPTLMDLFFKEYLRIMFDPLQFYTHRISAIYGLESVFAALKNKDKARDSYAKAMNKAAEDPIVNIRQVAVKILANSVRKGSLTENNENIKMFFAKIKQTEKDNEVRFIIEDFLR